MYSLNQPDKLIFKNLFYYNNSYVDDGQRFGTFSISYSKYIYIDKEVKINDLKIISYIKIILRERTRSQSLTSIT